MKPPKRPRLTMLKPTLATLPDRLQTFTGSWRTRGMKTAARGYGARWQRERDDYLRLHPLCIMCEQESPPRVTAATIVDHRIPHRGDEALFWDRNNWQSLCTTHHSSDKQRQEREEAAGLR
jgi:5-methylcytosine-specific restriction enzyme A